MSWGVDCPLYYHYNQISHLPEGYEIAMLRFFAQKRDKVGAQTGCENVEARSASQSNIPWLVYTKEKWRVLANRYCGCSP